MKNNLEQLKKIKESVMAALISGELSASDAKEKLNTLNKEIEVLTKSVVIKSRPQPHTELEYYRLFGTDIV